MLADPDPLPGPMTGSAAPRDFQRRWPSLLPPLRPPASVAAQIAALLPVGDQPTLLLGVTPELATITTPLIAADWNPAMIAMAWPGDMPDRWALCADWLHLPLAPASIGAAIGDGALTMLVWPEQHRMLAARLAEALAPGGRIVLRCFATPDPPPDPDAVCADALAGGLSFHAFKLGFNMAIAAREADGNVTSAALHAAFERRFPDRTALAAASGWSLATIAEIDAYRGSAYVHCYPGRAALLALFADIGRARLVETQGYPFAEHCPLLVVDLP